MLNIQFMTEDNAYVRKDGRKVYIPNWEELKKRVCCKEEYDAICRAESYYTEHPENGFAFKIVYTDFHKSIEHHNVNGRWTNEFVMKWQLMQHPWIVGKTEEEMINDIARCYCDRSNYWNMEER